MNFNKYKETYYKYLGLFHLLYINLNLYLARFSRTNQRHNTIGHMITKIETGKKANETHLIKDRCLNKRLGKIN